MDNLLDVLKSFPSNMDEVNQFSRDIEYEVEFGNIEAMVISKKLKLIAKACSIADDNIQEIVLDEAEKLHKEELREIWGAVIKEVGTKYDFSKCNDSEYYNILTKENELKSLKNERIKFLKSLKPGMAVNPDTGEELFPPSKSSMTKVVFTLK